MTQDWEKIKSQIGGSVRTAVLNDGNFDIINETITNLQEFIRTEIESAQKEEREKIVEMIKGMFVKTNHNNFFKEKSYNQALANLLSLIQPLKDKKA